MLLKVLVPLDSVGFPSLPLCVHTSEGKWATGGEAVDSCTEQEGGAPRHSSR